MIRLNYHNLAKLRSLMIGVQAAEDSGSLGPGGSEFNMNVCRQPSACGTAACAAGWSEIMGILPIGASWLDWCIDPSDVGSNSIGHEQDRMDTRSIVGQFLFASGWYRVAPRPGHVVDRIDYLASHDLADPLTRDFLRSGLQPPPYTHADCPERLAVFAEPVPPIQAILDMELAHRLFKD